MGILSIVIPVYNEKETIRKIHQRVLEAPLPGGLRKEIVYVDDSSTDGTREILNGKDGVCGPALR